MPWRHRPQRGGQDHHHPHVPGPDGARQRQRAVLPEGAAAVHAARCAGHQRRSWAWSQFDTLDPDFTCAENLRVFGRYFGLKGRTMDERVPQLLEFAALTHKADAKPGELSAG